MSQTNADATDSIEQSDSPDDDSSVSVAPAVIAEIKSARMLLENMDVSDFEEMGDDELVDVWTEIKALADELEDARKERAEEVLDDRVEPGERLHGLNRIQSHRKYVDEDVGSVIMRAVGAGIDYTEFVSLNASALADADIDAEIGRSEYTYYR